MKKIKYLILALTLVSVMFIFTGCRRPYDTPEFVTIEASQTAFLIPLVGDSSNQAAFESEELLLETKVATKEIQIPHRWVQTGRRNWQGEWRDSSTLIIVERKPVSRSWDSGDNAAESANRAVFGETSDGIGIYVGMNCSAQINESDAARFLYRYNNTPLSTIIDTDIKKMVEDEFNMQTAKYTSSELLSHKTDIIEGVRTRVTEYFKDYGITITVLGIKEGFSYENASIQLALDEKFASEQKFEIQENENAANIEKAKAEAEAVKLEAEAEAAALLTRAEAQAKANKLLAESLTDEVIAQMYYDKWDGALPYIYGADTNALIQIPSK